MSTIVAKRKDISGFNTPGDLVEWTGLQLGDDGSRLEGVADSIQVEGVFGENGALTIEGSNDGERYHAVTDVLGPGLVTVDERPRFLRPRVPTGDATTSITVIALVRR